MKISLFFLVLFKLAFAQESFQATIKPEGHFNINYNMKMTNYGHIADAFYELFLDEKNQLEVNDDLISQSANFDLTKNLNTSESNTVNYILTTKAKRMGVTAKIDNKCVLNISESRVSQHCEISNSSAGIFGSLFNYGSTSINCSQLKNNLECNINIKGQTKSKNLGIISRTDDRLAISGTSQTIADLHKMYLLMTRNITNSNDAFSSSLNGLWDKMFNHLNSSEKLDYTLSVKSNGNSVEIKKAAN